MGMSYQEYSQNQDAEWDADLVENEKEKPEMIVDNKWVLLALMPAKIVILSFVSIIGLLMCSLILSPAFIAYKMFEIFCMDFKEIYDKFREES
jgi:hypothetical protein